MDRNRAEMLMLLTGWRSRVNDAEGRLIPLAQQDRRKTAPQIFLGLWMDRSNRAAFVAAPNTNFLYANPAVLEYTGLTKEELGSGRFPEVPLPCL